MASPREVQAPASPGGNHNGNGRGKSSNGSKPSGAERDAVRDLLMEESMALEEPAEIDRRVLLGPVTRRSPAKMLATLGVLSAVEAGALWLLLAAPVASWPWFALAFVVLFVAQGALLQMGAVLAAASRHRRGDVEGALRLLNAMGRWTGRPDAFVPARAGILVQSGHVSEAVEIIRARREHLGRQARHEADERLAVALILLETDLAEAERLLKEALSRDPRRHELRASLGMCLYLLDRYEESGDELIKIGDRIAGMEGARRATLFFALGDSFWQQKRFKEAAPWLRLSREWVEKEREARLLEAEDSQGEA